MRTKPQGTFRIAAEAYLGCLARLAAVPEATLFVDDSARNVAGAERAGLAVHLFRDCDGLTAALAAAGLPAE